MSKSTGKMPVPVLIWKSHGATDILPYVEALSIIENRPEQKKLFHNGWGDEIRTHDYRIQSPIPYRLATSRLNFSILVGVEGLEPPISPSQTVRLTKLAYTP